MAAAVCKEEEKAKEILSHLEDRTLFWRVYQDMINVLLKRVERQNGTYCYPWTKKDVSSGVNERPYMDELIANHKWPKALKFNDSSCGFSSLPEFSKNTHKYSLSLNTTVYLDRVFEKFTKSKSDYCHTFLVGQTNHWVTIIVNKVNGFVETLLCDSRNSFALGMNYEEIKDMILTRGRKNGKVKDPEPWKLELWITSFIDIQFTTQLIHDCATGKTNAKDQLIHLYIEGFFENYHKSID
jgi:hypothetical protein